MSRLIYFDGKLKKHTGLDSVRLTVHSMRHLIETLDYYFPGAKQLIMSSSGVSIGVDVNGTKRFIEDEDLILFDLPEGDILLILADDYAGAEIAAYLIANGWAAWAAYSAAVVSVLAINYVASVIMKSLYEQEDKKDAEKNDSYLFDGPQNTVGQGEMIPIAVGRFRCGSAVISQELSAERMPTAMDDSIDMKRGETKAINLLANDVIIRDGSVVVNGTSQYQTNQSGSTTIKSVSYNGTSITVNSSYAIGTSGVTVKWQTNGDLLVNATTSPTAGLKFKLVYVLENTSVGFTSEATASINIPASASNSSGSYHSSGTSENGKAGTTPGASGGDWSTGSNADGSSGDSSSG